TQAYLAARGSQLLEFGNRDASETAQKLLETPMLPQAAVDISQWLRIVSRLADVYDPVEQHFVERGSLLSYAGELGGQVSLGEALERQVLLMLDAAIANYSLKYSDELAQAAIAALNGPESART